MKLNELTFSFFTRNNPKTELRYFLSASSFFSHFFSIASAFNIRDLYSFMITPCPFSFGTGIFILRNSYSLIIRLLVVPLLQLWQNSINGLVVHTRTKYSGLI